VGYSCQNTEPANKAMKVIGTMKIKKHQESHTSGYLTFPRAIMLLFQNNKAMDLCKFSASISPPQLERDWD